MAFNSQQMGYLKRGLLVVGVSVAALVAWIGFSLWQTWQSAERVAFVPADARVAMERDQGQTLDDDGTDDTAAALRDELVAILLVGSDERPQIESRRADVIMMLVVPPDGLDPLLFSLPRDLYLPDPCSGGRQRINAALNGCGDQANGPELLAIVVEDFTGIRADHFAIVNFWGFRDVIDAVGGVEICVDNPVRDANTRPDPLDLPAGCTSAEGGQALAWMRSRRTQEFIDNRWRLIGVSDFDRNQRQQELILQALIRLRDFRNVSELTALAESLRDAFVIDEAMSIADAVSLAWFLRGLDLDAIVRPVIPTRGLLAPNGDSVVTPTESFADTLRAVYPDAAQLFAEIEESHASEE
jgi:LCP family protein required for cell wall assembly